MDIQRKECSRGAKGATDPSPNPDVYVHTVSRQLSPRVNSPLTLISNLLHAAMQISLGSSPKPNFEYCLAHKMKCGRVDNHGLPLSKLSVAISTV